MRWFLAGIEVGDAMIGEDLLDVVTEKDPDRPDRVFAQISESRVGRCIRTPDWLYALHAPGVEGSSAPGAELYADDFLYDLRSDPDQLHNLVGDPAYTAARDALRAQLLDWIQKTEGVRPRMADEP